jgi:hypothetical protein
VRNNPLKYVDPSGHAPKDPCPDNWCNNSPIAIWEQGFPDESWHKGVYNFFRSHSEYNPDDDPSFANASRITQIDILNTLLEFKLNTGQWGVSKIAAGYLATTILTGGTIGSDDESSKSKQSARVYGSPQKPSFASP